MAEENYEFSSGENEKIGKLAGRMKFVGITLCVCASLQILSIFKGNVPGLIAGIFYLLIGIWTFSAANSFQRIVDSEGKDIGHLMNALANLHKLYTLQMALIIVAIVLLVIGTFIT